MRARRWLLLSSLAPRAPHMRRLFAALVVLVVVGVVIAGPGQHLDLAWLKAHQADLALQVAADRTEALLWAFVVYVAATALSIPVATVLSLAIGAVFGLGWGTVVVSFASTLGATLAFLAARYLLRNVVHARFATRIAAIERGVREDGPRYVLTLRLLPVIPFVLVNVLLGVSPLRLRDFVVYSQLGMLPATLVYVNAGTELARIERVDDIVSAPLLGAFALLAALPFATKLWFARRDRKRWRERYPAPAQVDRNVIVIGAGAAGLVAAVSARALKARVTLIESERMGGECLNTGCVPSKALLAAARTRHRARHADRLGLRAATLEFDFRDVMARIAATVARIAPHDSVERMRSLGVECIQGHARVISPYSVAVDGRELSARAIVLATGAAPRVPPLPGLDAVPYLTSDNLWTLDAVPARLLVLGGGPVGCELAQAFARFGAAVTIVEMASRLLPREDAEVGALVARIFADEGITVHTGTRALEFLADRDGQRVRCAPAAPRTGDTFTIAFDRVLIALGRAPRVHGYGLEELGLLDATDDGLDIDERLRTRLPGVFACGDVAGPYQFTHAGAHQAWHATLNALFGDFKSFAIDYRCLPWCVFVDPEVARVGLNEDEARARRIGYEVTRLDLATFDRAVIEGEAHGFVKVLTAPGSDRILGVTIVGAHAGEMLAEFVLAMRHGLGLGRILATVHAYPTWNDANKLAAGAWRRAHVPAWTGRMLERFHRWRREGRD